MGEEEGSRPDSQTAVLQDDGDGGGHPHKGSATSAARILAREARVGQREFSLSGSIGIRFCAVPTLSAELRFSSAMQFC